MIVHNFHLKHLLKKTLLLSGRFFRFPSTHPSQILRERSAQRTADFIEANMLGATAFDTEKEILRYSVEQAKSGGYYLEFGVFKGGTIRYMAKLLPNQQFHGFDSFKGLPGSWSSVQSKGAFNRGGVAPSVPSNVKLHTGWFCESLPKWFAENPGKISFAHIDCDIYSSTVDILNNLAGHIEPGTIILFDEYLNYPGWEQHEHKAWKEFTQQNKVDFEYIAFASAPVAVRITSVG